MLTNKYYIDDEFFNFDYIIDCLVPIIRIHLSILYNNVFDDW